MKIAFLIGLAVILTIAAVGLSSCGTGTTIGFTPEGVVITPPATPIVIPTK